MRIPRRAVVAVVAALVLEGIALRLFVQTGASSDVGPPPPADLVPIPDAYAFLVGCTEYPTLRAAKGDADYEASVRLVGPGNDVRMIRDTLVRWVGVPAANIEVLTAWPSDPAARPTRANILAGLDRFARRVPRGGRFLFLFAGHGTQQPDAEGNEKDDGAAEVLMPADTGPWDETRKGLANGIVDDEIGARLVAIRDAGAQVVAVFDCCHSGTMMRGGLDEAETEPVEELRSRGLKPDDLGVPSFPGRTGSSSRGGVGSDGGPSKVEGILPDAARGTAGLVAIYAAHSSETAPEMKLPRDRSAPGREVHGLLSFQLSLAWKRFGAGLSVAELFEHVRAAYASMPWNDTSPLVDGDVSIRFGSAAPTEAGTLLLRRDGARLLVDAGSVRGLTVGSVLEVFPPGASGAIAKALGRLTLIEVEPLYSVCAAVPGGLDPAAVPTGAPARLVELAPGGPKLRLAVRDETSDGNTNRSRSALRLDPAATSNLALVPPYQAEWILVRPTGGGPYRLGPADESLGIVPFDVEAAELADALDRVRRADALRRFAAADGGLRLPEGVVVTTAVRRPGAEGLDPIASGAKLLPGDRLVVSILNGSGRDVDVAIKNLDAQQRETHVWPDGSPSRRIERAERTAPVDSDEFELSDDGFGRGSLIVVVATRGSVAGTLDVGALSGPSVAARSAELARVQGERALLDTVVPPDSRAVDEKPAEAVGVCEISWTTTWGRFGTPTPWFEGMAALEPGLRVAPGGLEGDVPPGRRCVWRKAGIVPGEGDAPPMLHLSGDGEEPGTGANAFFLDADGDAGLASADPVEAARRLAAGELPVELGVVLQAGGSSAWTANGPADRSLGIVHVAATDAARDQCVRRYERTATGWVSRPATGPWLSTGFLPETLEERDRARSRLVAALRRITRIK